MAKVRDFGFSEIVARNVRMIREAKGLTQKELAKKANWRNQSLLNQIEKGHRSAGPQSLRKLAEALEVDPEVLYAKNLSNAPIFRGKTGISETIDNKHSAFKAWLSIIDFRNLQEIRSDYDADESHCLKTFPMIKKYDFGDYHTLIAGVVDIEDMIPEYYIGDIVCVDMNKNNILKDAAPSRYLCKINNKNVIYVVQKVGNETIFMKIPQDLSDRKILRLDEDFGINVILGKILWETRFHE